MPAEPLERRGGGLGGSGGVPGERGQQPQGEPCSAHLGRSQAPGGAAAGEEPRPAVGEHGTAHLQQRPER